MRRESLDCDSEPLFFRPYDNNNVLEEVGKRPKGAWKETLDKHKYTNPEWVPNVPYVNPQVRSLWFLVCFDKVRTDLEIP